MSLICRASDRALARLAASGTAEPEAPWLRRHLGRCEGCRAAWEAYRRMGEVLPEALEAPVADDRFVAGVWTAIDAHPAGHKAGRRVAAWNWAVAAAAVAALVLTVANSLGPRQGDSAKTDPGALQVAAAGDPLDTRPQSSGMTGQGAQRAAGTTDARKATAPKVAKRSEASPRRQTVRRLTERESAAARAAIQRMLRRRLANSGTVPQARSASSSATEATTTTASSWLDWARYYESQSNHASAAYAYRQAWREGGDTSTAYAAARTSEAAGDIVGAVEFYARILDDSEPQRAPIEGSSHHNSDRAVQG